jgi:5-methylcytosine-specific restriction endonuclease McrA
VGVTLEVYLAHLAIGEKWCTRCKNWHSRDIFTKDSTRSDGLDASCRGYKPKTKKTKEQIREANNATQRRRYAGPSGPRIRAHIYARKRRMEAVLPEERELAMELTGGVCAYCGNTATSIDHIIPVSRGGRSKRGNLLPCCDSCNSKKHTSTLDDFVKVCPSPDLYAIESALSLAEINGYGNGGCEEYESNVN